MEGLILNSCAKRILIIVSDLLPNTTANGVCVYNIAREYVKNGRSVYCIALREAGMKKYETIDGIHIYRVEEAWFTHFQRKCSVRGKAGKLYYKFIHLVRNICLIPLYPNVAPVRSVRIYRLVLKLVRQEKIDTVIGTFRPYESIYTVLRLKREFGEKLTCVSYYLDMLLQKKQLKIGYGFYERRSMRAQRKDIRFLDRIVVPSANKDEFEKMYGTHDNVEFVEFPVYIKGKAVSIEKLPFQKGLINLVYVGTLNREDRNPKRLLSLLSSVQKYIPNVRLHIWGNISDVKEILDSYPDVAVFHGYASSESVMAILHDADWLVNISNKCNYNMIPSKIFQLFASGKPILDYVFERKDMSLPYFERYENTCFVYDDRAEDIATIDGLVAALKRKWPLVNADEKFLENTPKVVAERILGETFAE